MQTVHGNLGLEGFIMDGTKLNDEFVKNLGQRAVKANGSNKGSPARAATEVKDAAAGAMSNKEQFLALVLVGALAQDFSRKTHDTSLIMHIAGGIPEDQIPDNPVNAAKVFLAYCSGLCKLPHHWMLARA